MTISKLRKATIVLAGTAVTVIAVVAVISRPQRDSLGNTPEETVVRFLKCAKEGNYGEARSMINVDN